MYMYYVAYDDELLNKLKGIVDILIHCEQYFINNIDQVKEVMVTVLVMQFILF